MLIGNSGPRSQRMGKYRFCSTFPAKKHKHILNALAESTFDKVGVAATGGYFLLHFEHYTTQVIALCASEPIGEDPIAPPVGVHKHKPRRPLRHLANHRAPQQIAVLHFFLQDIHGLVMDHIQRVIAAVAQ